MEAQNHSDEPNTCVHIDGPLASMYDMADDCDGTYCFTDQMAEWSTIKQCYNCVSSLSAIHEACE